MRATQHTSNKAVMVSTAAKPEANTAVLAALAVTKQQAKTARMEATKLSEAATTTVATLPSNVVDGAATTDIN